MRIAILGSSGRVASRIVNEALMRGHEVVGIDIKNKEEFQDKITFYQYDMEDVEHIAEAIRGCDVYIFAVIPVLKGVDKIVTVVKCAIEACRRAGVPRMIYICGGVSSWIRPGVYLLDDQKQPGHRQTHKANDAIIGSHEVALEYLRTVDDFDWCCQTAPLWMEENMGGRTGKYRMGTEYPVLIDPDNKEISLQQNSHISMEDFAVCMIDEVEQSRHHKCRYTVGY